MKFKPGDGHDELEPVIGDSCSHTLIRLRTCEAFPDGIPEGILNRKIIHSKSLPE